MNNGQFKERPLDMRITKKILELICDYYVTDLEALKGRNQKGTVMRARLAAYYLLKKYSKGGVAQIGLFLNRNHATVIRGCTTVENALFAGQYVSEDIAFLKSQLKRWLNHPWKYSNQTLANYTMKSLLDRKVNKHLTAA